MDDENGSSSISEKIREVNTLCIAYGNGMQPLECTPFFRQIFRIAMMIWLPRVINHAYNLASYILENNNPIQDRAKREMV